MGHGGSPRDWYDRVVVWGGVPPTGVVTLCGSTRFKDEFVSEQRRLSLEGYIVISVGLFGHSGDLTPGETVIGHPVKDRLDELHKRKIDMSDSIHVINVGGYVGESTRSEIEYATTHGKRVTYMEPPS